MMVLATYNLSIQGYYPFLHVKPCVAMEVLYYHWVSWCPSPGPAQKSGRGLVTYAKFLTQWNPALQTPLQSTIFPNAKSTQTVQNSLHIPDAVLQH